MGTACNDCMRCDSERASIRAAQQEAAKELYGYTAPAPEPAPVQGYTKPSAAQIKLVNENKLIEEIVMRQIDRIIQESTVFEKTADPRMAEKARLDIIGGFMWLNRSIFRPERLKGDLT